MIESYEDVLDLILEGKTKVSREDFKKLLVLFDMGFTPSRATLLTHKDTPEKTSGVEIEFGGSSYMFEVEE